MRPAKIVWAMSLFLLLLVLAACGSETTSETMAEDNAPVEPEVPATATPEPSPAVANENINTPAAAVVPQGDPQETGLTRYEIVPEGTEVRFLVDEILLGEDKQVVGVTSIVTGEIHADIDNPATAQIGTLQIDASDLTTDSRRRNTSIKRYVLQSARDEYQYITFEPTAIEGLPDSVTVGQPFEFAVTGDLTVRDVTLPQTFAMTATVRSEDELVGLGTTNVTREEYGLTIPSVPAVASVSDEVRLEIEFTARASE